MTALRRHNGTDASLCWRELFLLLLLAGKTGFSVRPAKGGRFSSARAEPYGCSNFYATFRQQQKQYQRAARRRR